MSKLRRPLLAIALGLLAVEALWAWPWSHDLVVQMFIRPQQQLFTAPAGAVAVTSEAPMTRAVAERVLHNPVPATHLTLAQGQKLFKTYCLVCHGAEGRGNGPVAGGALVPADLTSARVQALSDGTLYHTMRQGFGLMPAYYDRLKPEERWRLVLYVRTLGAGK